MSLLPKLPNEILSDIFKTLKAWDDIYGDPYWRDCDGPKEGERLRKWFGRSRIALSLVNRRLREVGTPFLRPTVTVKQTQGEIFSSLILGGPLARAITTIDLESVNSADSLSPFILDVLPNLPALRTISGLKQSTLTAIMGADEGVGDVLKRGRLRRRRQVFLDTLARIKEWKVNVSAESLGMLLSASGANVRVLSVGPVIGDNLRADILGYPKSGYMAVVAQFQQLKELKIDSTYFARFSDPPTPSRVELVHSNALRFPFAFGNSLRSLDLSTYWNQEGLTGSILPFVASFPNLTDLALGNDWLASETPPGTVPLRLVHLRRLNITQSILLDYPDDGIYQYLLAPKLASIDIGLRPFEAEEFRYLSISTPPEIKSTIPSLRRIIYGSETQRRIPQYFVQDLARVGIQVVLAGGSNRFTKFIRSLDNNDGEEEEDLVNPEYDEIMRVRYLRAALRHGDTLAFDAVEDMSNWISEKVKELRVRNDVDGAKELARRMRGTSDYRRWLE